MSDCDFPSDVPIPPPIESGQAAAHIWAVIVKDVHSIFLRPFMPICGRINDNPVSCDGFSVCISVPDILDSLPRIPFLYGQLWCAGRLASIAIAGVHGLVSPVHLLIAAR